MRPRQIRPSLLLLFLVLFLVLFSVLSLLLSLFHTTAYLSLDAQRRGVESSVSRVRTVVCTIPSSRSVLRTLRL